MSEAQKINTIQVNRQADAMAAEVSDLRAIAQQIWICRQSLQLQTGNSDTLKHQISRLYDQALTSAAHLDTLKGALKEIVQLYVDCEGRVLNNANGTAEQSRSSGNADQADAEPNGTEKRSWWQRLLDWFFRRDTDPLYTHTTSEQEAAADAQMRDQIQQMNDSDRYSEENWENATVEERKQILQEYMRSVMEIMGLDINENVNFFSEAPSNGLITNGYFSSDSDRVSINAYIIEHYSAARSYQLFTTIVHELRHAYQHAAVENPTRYQVSQETIDRWSDSFDNYRGTDRIVAEDGVSWEEAYEMYRNQAVEADARAFAGQD